MNNTDIRRRVNSFAENLSGIMNDQNNSQYELLFYMTRRCNLMCPGCYMMGQGASDTRTMDSADIDFYVNEFKKERRFKNSVVFSGGEIFVLPTKYLEYNISHTLNTNGALHLKTNGSWIENKYHSDEIFEMMSGLNVPRGLYVDDTQIHAYLTKFSKKYIEKNRQKVLERMMAELPTVSALDLCMSVDNKIHPEKSADWFCDIVRRVGGDKKLAKNLNIKSFSFVDTIDFFDNHVMERLKRSIKQYTENINVALLEYNVGHAHVESYFGPFVDVRRPFEPETMLKVGKDTGDDGHRVVFHFFPDKTVAFCTDNFHFVGRVPYVTMRGRYKSVAELRHDMFNRVVDEYRYAIKR